MKEINGYLLVEVPEGSCEKSGNAYQFYRHKMSEEQMNRIMSLMNEPYDIIGLAKDLTPEQKAEIVEMKKTFGYRNYTAVNGEYQWTNLEKSFDSLLKANNLSPDTTLILKKIL